MATEDPKPPETKPAGEKPAFDPDAFSRDLESRVSQAVAAQLGAFREALSQIQTEKPDPKPAQEDDWDTKFYASPKDTIMSTLDQYGKDLATQIEAKLRGEYQQDRAENEFWSGFYADNAHLRDYDYMLRALVSKNQREWVGEKISNAEAYKRMIEEVEGIGGKLSRKQGAEPESDEGRVIDGLAFIKRRNAKEGADAKPLTLTEVIKNRQKEIRERA